MSNDALFKCPKCGSENETVRKYCWVCYQSFEQGKTPAPTPPSMSPTIPSLLTPSPKLEEKTTFSQIVQGVVVILGLYVALALLDGRAGGLVFSGLILALCFTPHKGVSSVAKGILYFQLIMLGFALIVFVLLFITCAVGGSRW